MRSRTRDLGSPGRLGWTIVLATAFVLSISAVLATRVPDVVDDAFILDGLGWMPRAVPLTDVINEPVPVVAGLSLAHRDPRALLEFPELRILLATYSTSPRLLGGELRVLGTTCTYRTPPDAELLNNELLAFRRGDDCRPGDDSPSGRLQLVIRFEGPGRLAAWTYSPPPGAEERPGMIFLDNEAPGAAADALPLVLRGQYFEDRGTSAYRRVDLLDYQWHVSDSPIWIWRSLAAAWLMVVAGLLILPVVSPAGPRWRTALRCAVGSGLLAAALGLLYAVLVPPLQAPDESIHVRSYARSVDRPMIPPALDDWIQLTHFARIRFHTAEHFRPRDVESPAPPDLPIRRTARDQRARGPVTHDLWTFTAPWLQALTLSQTFLALRLINALIFAIAVGLAAATFVTCCDVTHPQLLGLSFLLVPTLPFFAMHVSDYAALTSAYVLVSAAIGCLFLDGRRASLAGLVLGLGTALVAASSRSALPMLGVVATVALARLLLGARDARRPRSAVAAASAFWGGMLLAVIGTTVLTNAAYQAYVWSALAPQIPRALAGLVESAPSLAYDLLLVVVAAAFADVGLTRARAGWSGGDGARALSRWLSRVAVGTASLIVMSLGLSILVDLPTVPDIQSTGVPALGTYLSQVLLSMATVFRLRGADWFLSSTFIGGFGWLDTMPPPWFGSLLVAATGAALTVLLLDLARTRQTRRLVWLMAIAGGMTATLVLYTAAAHAVPLNLHGRYLIGFYLTGLVVSWSVAGGSGAARTNRSGPGWIHHISRVDLAMVACALIHAYSLHFILRRYF